MFIDDTLDKIIAALPCDESLISTREVLEIVDCWCLGSIRLGLIELEKTGRAKSELVKRGNGVKRLWRRQPIAVNHRSRETQAEACIAANT